VRIKFGLGAVSAASQEVYAGVLYQQQALEPVLRLTVLYDVKRRLIERYRQQIASVHVWVTPGAYRTAARAKQT
jgi:hypothetical protein